MSAFPSLALPVAKETNFLINCHITVSGKANLVGLSLFVGGELQHRIGPMHLGFGPGAFAGVWLLTPDDDCEDDYSCVPGIAGLRGFGVAGEIGYSFFRSETLRSALVARAVTVRISHDLRLIQLYLGVRVSL